MSAAVDIGTFRTHLASRGVDAATLRAREDGTLGATAPTISIESLRGEAVGQFSDESLEVGAVLGRGGMGEVRSAIQSSLRREVAVKTVLDVESVPAQAALLKEAWAGGALEHPSVVPIHTITRVGNAAAVVMKRVAGTSWGDILEDPSRHPRFRGEGALEAHLRVFVQVCHAIAFAHERGILHLDLKPENVMVGALGEVYVLDWGLAAATDEGPPWLTRARDMPLPAGTPTYMAPELAGALNDKVGRCTDVYLLGAVLHHAVTGRPRHDGESLVAVLAAAYIDDAPEYGPEVPRELASILRRALARETSDRWPSADAMREAVEAFLKHRPAEHFMARAKESLAALEARLEKGEKGDLEIEPLLAECEVAIAQVRRAWATHPDLDEAERTLVWRRARHAIVEERADAAHALLARRADVPESLRSALAALDERLAERDRYVRNLESMAREVDFSMGSVERRRLIWVLGTAWLVLSVAMGWIDRLGILPLGYEALLVEGALLVATLGPFGWVNRNTYFQNRANRRLWGGLTFLAVAVELLWIAGASLGIEVHRAIALTPIVYAYGFAALAGTLDRRFLPGSLICLCTAAVTTVWPAWSFDLVGLGGGLATYAILWATRRPISPGPSGSAPATR